MKNYLSIFILVVLFSGCSFQQGDDYTGIHDSNLPSLIIDTHGKEIMYEPKSRAMLTVITPGSEEFRRTIEEFNIGIEYRGLYSGTIPKKQYGFEVQSVVNYEQKVSLLGMPSESDWVLYGPYSDKTLLRNYLAYSLWEQMGNYSPKGRFVELYTKEYIDKEKTNQYQGIYLLLEKVKRSRSRLYFQSAPTHNINRGNLTFLIELFPAKRKWMSTENFKTESSESWFSIIYPGKKKLNTEYLWHVENFVNQFESLLYAQNTLNEQSYFDFIDPFSVADYILFNEFVKNDDVFFSSLFVYKDADSTMKLGPVWDYNIAFGNVDYSNARYPEGWLQNDLDRTWIDSFVKDTVITNYVKMRWKYFRTDIFTSQVIDSLIDSKVKYLNEARIRNFVKWNILGERLWPNPSPVPETYEEEIKQLKKWISARIEWMDANIDSF
ncbi:MAG: CotH kinase family protein [Bacteroidales bacterium]|nr:CotH kinase family protein [Bacteroidales bacterium]